MSDLFGVYPFGNRPVVVPAINTKLHKLDKQTRGQDPYELVISAADHANNLETAVLEERQARLGLPHPWSWVMSEHGKRRVRDNGVLIKEYWCEDCAGRYPRQHHHPLPCELSAYPVDDCACIKCAVAGARGLAAAIK